MTQIWHRDRLTDTFANGDTQITQVLHAIELDVNIEKLTSAS